MAEEKHRTGKKAAVDEAGKGRHGARKSKGSVEKPHYEKATAPASGYSLYKKFSF